MRRRNSLFFQFLLLAGVLLILTQVASAQLNSTVEGTVLDSSGAVVPSAQVTVTNLATGVAYRSTTNNLGLFRVPTLPGGTYRVEVEAAGFRQWVLNELALEGAQVRTLRVSLDVGTQQEIVEVRATAAAVETGRIATGAEIQASTIEQAPLPLRNVYRGLVAMVPGVTGTGGGGNDNYNPEASYGINAAGQKHQHNEYQMDGVQIANSSRGGETYFSPQPDIVEAVNVTASEFSAEKGRFSGARIQVYTKSGTNDFHGVFSEFYTNNRMQARTLNQAPLPEATRHEFGGTFGGPIKRDRTFFFGAVFGLLETTAITQTPTLETPEFRNFIINNYPNSVGAEIFRRATPLAEPSRDFETLSQHMVRVPGRLAVPDSWPRDMPLLGTAVVNASNPREGLQANVKLDHHFANQKDRLTYSYLMQNRYTVSFNVRPEYNGSPRPAANSMHRVAWVRTFSTTLISETSFNWIRTQGGSHPRPPSGVSHYFMETPGFTITGLSNFNNSFGAVRWDHNDFSWRQVFGWTRGAHNLRFGIDIDHQRDDNPFTNGFGRPQFSFANILDFAQDFPFSQTGPVMDTRTGQNATDMNQIIRMTYFAPFIQHTWKVSRNFTLNMGVRYDDFGHIASVTNEGTPVPQFTYSPGQPIAEGSMRAIGGGNKGWISADRISGWSPRVGFGWDIFGDGKLAVRGGWGMYYNKLGSLAWIARINPPTWAQTSVTIQDPNPVFSYMIAPGFTDGQPQFQVPPSAVIEVDPFGGIVGQRVGVAGAAAGMQAPRTQSWMLSIQRTLGEQWLVDLSYNGNHSDRQWIATDINRFAGDLLDGTLNRLHQSFGVINQGQTYGRANGHLGTLMVQKRFSQGYSLRTMFSFGRSLDNFSTIASTGPGNPGNVVDWTNVEAQYSRANFDVARRVAVKGIYNIPSPWRTGVGGQVVGGWTLSVVSVLQSGSPFDVFSNAVYPTGDFNADGFRYDFPNAPAFGTQIPGSRKRSDFMQGVFARADFPLPTAGGVRGVQGNLRRNSYTGPGFANVNVSLSKSFPLIREGTRLEFRADAFNVFNRVNLDAPQGNLTSNQFGRSTTSSEARQLMFGARVSF